MINKVILLGNLGRDPETRHTQSGTAVCTLSVATSRRQKSQSGQFEDKTEWHRVTVWDKRAEVCAKYLAKGRQVYVEGRIETRQYEQDGVKKYATDIIAHEVKFIGGGDSGGGRSSGGSSSSGRGGYDSSAPGDDYIPF